VLYIKSNDDNEFIPSIPPKSEGRNANATARATVRSMHGSCKIARLAGRAAGLLCFRNEGGIRQAKAAMHQGHNRNLSKAASLTFLPLEPICHF